MVPHDVVPLLRRRGVCRWTCRACASARRGPSRRACRSRSTAPRAPSASHAARLSLRNVMKYVSLGATVNGGSATAPRSSAAVRTNVVASNPSASSNAASSSRSRSAARPGRVEDDVAAVDVRPHTRVAESVDRRDQLCRPRRPLPEVHRSQERNPCRHGTRSSLHAVGGDDERPARSRDGDRGSRADRGTRRGPTTIAELSANDRRVVG